VGLWLSYRYDLTSGAAIIMVAGIAFMLSLLIERTGMLTRTKNKSATETG
jgi:zinc transport system permease protein